ncbi:MAG: hypothetical protein ACYDHP_11745 [Ferrimicrobium sp.]
MARDLRRWRRHPDCCDFTVHSPEGAFSCQRFVAALKDANA